MLFEMEVFEPWLRPWVCLRFSCPCGALGEVWGLCRSFVVDLGARSTSVLFFLAILSLSCPFRRFELGNSCMLLDGKASCLLWTLAKSGWPLS